MKDDDRWGQAPDDDLVRRFREGEEEAFGVLVERHHGVVYRIALSMVRDPDLAFDVAQDTFVKAYEALQGFRGEAAFRTWLLTIAANEGRGVLRRRGRRRETPLDAAGPVRHEGQDPAEEAVMKTEAARARAYMERLPEKQRLAVSLRLEDGLSFREVGAVIGSSEGAARVNYFHGVRRLREWME